MNVWKNNLAPILFAFASLAFLIAAMARPALERGPLNDTFLTFAIVFFGFAVVFLALRRKSGGGSRPPSV